jgi:hypothetical protein
MLGSFETRSRKIALDLDQEIDLVPLNAVVAYPGARPETRYGPCQLPACLFRDFAAQRVEQSLTWFYVTSGYVPAAGEQRPFVSSSMDKRATPVVDNDSANNVPHGEKLTHARRRVSGSPASQRPANVAIPPANACRCETLKHRPPFAAVWPPNVETSASFTPPAN